MSGRVSGMKLAVLIIGLGLGGALLSSHKALAADPAAIIPNASAVIVGNENNCYNGLRAENKTADSPRTQINKSQPYALDFWLSQYGASQNTVVSVPYGTTSVHLQLNQLEFLCAQVVKNSDTAAGGAGSASVTSVPYQQAKVTAANFAAADRHNRAPVPNNGNINSASLYYSSTRMGTGTVSGISGASIALDTAGDTFNIDRTAAANSGSRYWVPLDAANNIHAVGATLRTQPLTSTVTITVSFHAYAISTFNGVPGIGDSYCSHTGIPTTPSGYSICPYDPAPFTVTLQVQPPPVSGTINLSCNRDAAGNITGFGTAAATNIVGGNQVYFVNGAGAPMTAVHNAPWSWTAVPPPFTTTAPGWTLRLVVRSATYGDVDVGGLTHVPCTQPVAVTCSSTSFDNSTGVNTSETFTVAHHITGSTSLPPGQTNFAVTVTDPAGRATAFAPAANPPVSGEIVSDSMTYQIPDNLPGNYKVDWTYDSVACTKTVQVGYNPYFDVEGGDITAGAGFAPACTANTAAGIAGWNTNNNPAGQYFGAGAQDAAFVLSNIKSFATGFKPVANYVPVGSRATTRSLSQAHPYSLAFANDSGVNDNGGYGVSFGSLPCVTDYVGSVTTGSSGPISYTTSGTYIRNGTLNIGGIVLGEDSDVSRGHHGVVITIKVTGDVHISGPITYDDSDGPGNFPRLNLIATGNIYVDAGVGEIHGLFVAQGGDFITCANGGAEKTDYDGCSTTPLKVYGAVAATSIHLDRSYGTIGHSDGPAESFRYTPEFWLATPTCVALPTDPSCQGAAGTPKWNAQSSLPPVL